MRYFQLKIKLLASQRQWFRVFFQAKWNDFCLLIFIVHGAQKAGWLFFGQALLMRQKFFTITFRLISQMMISLADKLSTHWAESIYQSKIDWIRLSDEIFAKNDILMIVRNINLKWEIGYRVMVEWNLIGGSLVFSWICTGFNKLRVVSSEHL